MKIIFAQGNPEPEYSNSRHNVGCQVLNVYAKTLKVHWENKTKFNAVIAKFNINDEKILLVKPTSYYNESGLVVRKLVDFYKLNPATDLLVIHDDLSLQFGTTRIREQGSDAGNNGIKSINAHIDTPYKRIRIGICNELCEKMDDSSFVLSKFSDQESKQLEKTIIPHVIELIDQFYKGTLEITSHKNLE